HRKSCVWDRLSGTWLFGLMLVLVASVLWRSWRSSLFWIITIFGGRLNYELAGIFLRPANFDNLFTDRDTVELSDPVPHPTSAH
ncbi:hypothetical protein MK280_08980, partial [Myxococcota bacterium]|nr:hypothetical protein [Myxococcota bacterium]